MYDQFDKYDRCPVIQVTMYAVIVIAICSLLVRVETPSESIIEQKLNAQSCA